MDIGLPELLIVLVIVIVVFGVGRVGALGGELGRAIHAFRQGLRDDPRATPGDETASGLDDSNAAPRSEPGSHSDRI